jgi:hypothetical protein
MKLLQVCTLFVSVFVLSSCGSEGENKNKTTDQPDSLKKDTTAKKYSILSLPAPMQLPQSIRAHTDKFSEELLAPTHEKKPASEGTSVKKSITLGVYGVDLGYCILFDQNQHSINYISKISNLSQELSISGAFEASVVKRLKDNLSNKDSASYILLSSFHKARTYFSANKREEAGYLIAAGSFIEGMHLSLSLYTKKPNPELLKVIGQQKIFLDNLIALLAQYESEAEIKSFNNSLKELKGSFDKITVKLKPSATDKNVLDVESVEVPEGSLDNMLKQTEKIREIIK